MVVASSAGERTALSFGTVVVVGGGCYGSYYVRQLQRAAAAGAVRIGTLLVVDRDPACRVAAEQAVSAAGALAPRIVTADWSSFFRDYLDRAAEGPTAAANDAVVPSPLMPHLLYDWIAARMQARWPERDVRTLPLDDDLPVPWQQSGADGTRYASFATWICPINCIEPARCPHTRDTRSWTMPEALAAYVAGARDAGRHIAGPYAFHCTHRTFGVGMVDVSAVVAAEADLRTRAAGGAVEAIIGTVSHCHGAIGRLVVGEIPA